MQSQSRCYSGKKIPAWFTPFWLSGCFLLSTIIFAACQPALTTLPAGEIYTLALAPTGDYLAVGTTQGVHVYRLDDSQLLWTKRTADPVESLAFKPDGTQLVGRLADRNTTFILWQTEDGRKLREWQLKFRLPADMPLNWSPDGTNLLLTGDAILNIILLNVSTNQQYTLDWEGLHVFLTGPGPSLFGSAWSPDGKRLAFCTFGRAVELWDVPNNNQVARFVWEEINPSGIASVALDTTGTKLAATSARRGRIWEVETGTVLLELEAAPAPHANREDREYLSRYDHRVVWSPDDRWLVTRGYTNTIIVWDAATGEITHILTGHTRPVVGLGFHPHKGTLISASQDEILEWDIVLGTQLDNFEHLIAAP